MNEQDLKGQAALNELQLIITFLTQRCINLHGENMILLARIEEATEKKPPMKAVE
jgi:hypothetical protein